MFHKAEFTKEFVERVQEILDAGTIAMRRLLDLFAELKHAAAQCPLQTYDIECLHHPA